jgi:hypothetical protein
LGGNKLSGTIPSTWSRLSSLGTITLFGNGQLTGCLPKAWKDKVEVLNEGNMAAVAEITKTQQAMKYNVKGPECGPKDLEISNVAGEADVGEGTKTRAGPYVPKLKFEGTKLTGTHCTH